MLTQVVYLEIQPAKRETFLIEVGINILESRKEPGVIQFDLLEQSDSPNKFMLYETYSDTAALEAHRDTQHFKRWVEHGVPTLTGDRVRTIFHNIDI